VAAPVAISVPPIEALPATSKAPDTDTSSSNSALAVNVDAPRALNVPLTDTLFSNVAAPSTVTVDLNVAAPTAVTVL
jgi:hypothetical protein